jgi:hypothetical protein
MRSRQAPPLLRRAWLPALCALLMVIALVAWGIPWLTKSRADTTSVPTPPPFSAVTPIDLKGGSTVCENNVAFSPDARAATILTYKFAGAGPPLHVVASFPGYEGDATIAGGYGGEQPLRAEIPAPPRNAIGTLCITNTGKRPMTLQGTSEGRIQNRSVTSVDNKVIVPKLSLILTEQVNRSLADRPGEILARISAFKPWWIGSGSLVVLFALVLVGVPAGVLWAIWSGLANEEE